MPRIDKVLDHAVPVLIWIGIAAVVGLGCAAIAGAFEERGPACVTEVATTGQSVCVPQ